MADEIGAHLERSVRAQVEAIEAWITRPGQGLGVLEVILAGGGARIGFLRERLGRPIAVDGHSIRIRLLDVEERPGLDTHRAGRGRMAVALGGVQPEYETAILQPSPPVTIIRRGTF